MAELRFDDIERLDELVEQVHAGLSELRPGNRIGLTGEFLDEDASPTEIYGLPSSGEGVGHRVVVVGVDTDRVDRVVTLGLYGEPEGATNRGHFAVRVYLNRDGVERVVSYSADPSGLEALGYGSGPELALDALSHGLVTVDRFDFEQIGDLDE